MKQVAITFDFDFINRHGAKKERDELEEFWPLFLEICKRFPKLKTTWFIRMDEHIEHFFGTADYFFNKHSDKIEWLKKNDHTTGWHFHSFIKAGNTFDLGTNEKLISEELKRVHKITAKHELKILRMGFGFHSNVTLKTVADIGIQYDSSALPGNRENRNKTNADWSITPQTPYFPSVQDYRITGKENLSVLEIPLTTVNNDEKGSSNYLNPAYEKHTFKELISKTKQTTINTLTHPFEILDGSKTNASIEKGLDNFCSNLDFLQNQQFSFELLSELNTIKQQA